ncbi:MULTISPECIES: Ig-like domain-containing protein [unclassified Frankia]|uniref:L,D-transpeptidase n=1 Tax=unclassified Frankia TaxID=2632575 RepID=UPI001EF420B8|nr:MULTISPECIES: Ig-like domain-containing protein [unclassified Frankia]
MSTVVAALLAGAALMSCSPPAADKPKAGPSAQPVPTATAPQVVITPSDGAEAVAVTSTVVVRSSVPLQSVTAIRNASKSQETAAGVLRGELSADARTWTSTDGLFADTRYQVTAQTSAAPGGSGPTVTGATFTTVNPEKSLKVSWGPVDGQTVGIGTPITLTFSAPVTDRAAVQRRLAVTANPPVAGAWNWASSTVARWRPQQYWKAGTRVHVEARLAGFDAGGNRFGLKDRTMDFVIGPAQISYVDAAAHTMKVYRDGVLQRTLPVSLGKPSSPTMDGPHNVIATAPTVIMDSATVGIPKGDPDYYYETVQWNVQFTSGGEYVHSAPWSVGSQGENNVSHGCVNAAPADAEWFYRFSRLGDIVDVRNTGRPPDTTQLGNEWSISWERWSAGSALPLADTQSTAGQAQTDRGAAAAAPPTARS